MSTESHELQDRPPVTPGEERRMLKQGGGGFVMPTLGAAISAALRAHLEEERSQNDTEQQQ